MRILQRSLILAAFVLAPVSAAHAQTVVVNRIPAPLALEAVGEAVAACAKLGHAVTAVVIDIDGIRQAMLRGDVAPIHTVETAYMKAYTAVSVAPINKLDSSGAVAERQLKAGPVQPQPNVLLRAGGLTIRSGQEVIGAIGVGGAPGGAVDEGCARAGLERIRNRIK